MGNKESTTEYTEDEVQKALNNGAMIIDVRTSAEHKLLSNGHPDQTKNIPLGELEERKDELPVNKNQEIIVHCLSGHRSAQAADMLKKMGYTHVVDAGSLPNIRKHHAAAKKNGFGREKGVVMRALNH